MISTRRFALAVLAPLAAAALSSCQTATSSPAQEGQGIAVEVTPGSAQLQPSQQRTFAAVVTGTANTGVTWSVLEASGGTVASGLYTAPAVTGTYHVVATSVADPQVSGTASVLVANAPTTDVIPLDRRTIWNPGIPGGVPARATVCATINAATYGNGTTDARAAIQNAIDNCPVGQVVYVPAGTFLLSSGLSLTKGITLRGAGPNLTKLRGQQNDVIISIWSGWPSYGSAVNVTTNLAKGETQIPVASAASFAVGDIIQIDQLDDTSYLYAGGVPYFKRINGGTGYGPASTGPRSLGQTVEVTAKNGNTLTISPQLHQAYSLSLTPQVFKPTGGYVKYAGVEDLYVTGGNPEQIMILNAAYCWVKHVESDGTVSSSPASDGTLGQGNGMTGDHCILQRSFRCEIRDSYFHHATHVVQGGGAYGISLAEHTSDTLIENNIIWYMNKPLTMRASGGGNVVSYNYIEDAWTSADPGLQETTLDLGHASFPYMELAEGNWTGSIATENVWGNSGWMTIYRNRATGKQLRTAQYETYQIAAISMEIKAYQMNVIGNVLGSTGLLGPNNETMQYEVTSNPPGQNTPAVFRLGHGRNAGNGNDDIGTYENPIDVTSTRSMMLRTANWDNIRNQLDGNPGALPDSLYLLGKPSWWGAGAWPSINPYGATDADRAQPIPAKARFDAATPNG